MNGRPAAAAQSKARPRPIKKGDLYIVTEPMVRVGELMLRLPEYEYVLYKDQPAFPYMFPETMAKMPTVDIPVANITEPATHQMPTAEQVNPETVGKEIAQNTTVIVVKNKIHKYLPLIIGGLIVMAAIYMLMG